MKQYAIVLEHILKARLPAINRWKNVDVLYPGDDLPQHVEQTLHDIGDEQDVIIKWHGAKTKGNTHPYETKQVPVKDLKQLIKKNANKLVNESANWK